MGGGGGPAGNQKISGRLGGAVMETDPVSSCLVQLLAS
jgi:hypothetical protein